MLEKLYWRLQEYLEALSIAWLQQPISPHELRVSLIRVEEKVAVVKEAYMYRHEKKRKSIWSTVTYTTALL